MTYRFYDDGFAFYGRMPTVGEFENDPTLPFWPEVTDGRVTDLDLTEPLHDPADEETTDPGLPSHMPRAKERR